MSDLAEAVRAVVRGIVAALADGRIGPWEAVRLVPAIVTAVTEARETIRERTFEEIADTINCILAEFEFSDDTLRGQVQEQVAHLLAVAKEQA